MGTTKHNFDACPNVEALVGSGMLKSYTHYRDVSYFLSKEERKQAITEGFKEAIDK